jgi:hyperosmotically inducible periplasmic protein
MDTRRLTYSLLTAAACSAVMTNAPAVAQDRPATAPTTQERPVTARDTRESQQPVKDSWITMKVHAQFIPEDTLEDSDIDVETNNGVVTLTGTVPSATGRTRAVAIAKATDGVRNVEDKLRVSVVSHEEGTAVGTAGRETKDAAKSTAKAVSDGWIKSKIYSQFLTEDALDDSDINLDVQRGVVTLKGTVASAAGESRAEQIAKATDGVKSVNNNLKVAQHR